MRFPAAIRSGFSNYANFSGRALRSEYWYWTLFILAVGVPLSVVGLQSLAVSYLSSVFSIATALPGLAVAHRRLHDVGKSGWNILWAFVPLFGALYLLYLFPQPGDAGSNEYGPPPGGASRT